jgi:hypothetical protein
MTSHIKVSTALLKRLGGAAVQALAPAGKTLHTGARYAAAVPAGEAFAPTISTAARRVLKLGLNPQVKGWWNAPKRIAQGLGLYGVGAGAVQGREAVQGLAQNANQLIPDNENLKPLKQYTQDLADSPILTTLKTMFGGLPDTIPPGQRALLGDATYITGRNGLADWWNSIGRTGVKTGPGTWVQQAYAPAVRPAARGIRALLPDLPPASLAAYESMLRSMRQTAQEWRSRD